MSSSKRYPQLLTLAVVVDELAARFAAVVGEVDGLEWLHAVIGIDMASNAAPRRPQRRCFTAPSFHEGSQPFWAPVLQPNNQTRSTISRCSQPISAAGGRESTGVVRTFSLERPPGVAP